MKQISRWAHVHQKKAIACIVALKLILAFLAYYIGNYLKNSGYTFGPGTFLVLVIVLAIIVYLYPSRKKWMPSQLYFYEKQKVCDFLMTLCYFLMVCWLFNQEKLPALQTITMAVAPMVQPPPGKISKAQEILNSLSYRDKSSLTRKEKRILKTEFKRQIGIFAKATLEGNKASADSTWLVILAIIGAVGLGLVLAALVCSLSCGGSDGAAVVVGLIGLAAIIIGTIYLVRAIKKGGERREMRKKEKEHAPVQNT